MKVPGWLVSISIALNYMTCGPAHMSLCARVYLRSRENNYKAQILEGWIDFVFSPFESQHCRKSFIQWKLREIKGQSNVK